MRTAVTKQTIDLAKEHAATDPIAKAVADSVEVGIVVPSILRKNLEVAGVKITEGEKKRLKQIEIHDTAGVLIACGSSDGHADALLHAVTGYLRQIAEGDEATVEELDAQIAELKAMRERKAAATR